MEPEAGETKWEATTDYNSVQWQQEIVMTTSGDGGQSIAMMRPDMGGCYGCYFGIFKTQSKLRRFEY